MYGVRFRELVVSLVGGVVVAGALGADPPAATQPAEGWPRPRVEERQEDRDRMVRTQIGGGYDRRRTVRDKKVLEAMRNVPRHLFVPKGQRRRAYADHPLPIGQGQTISQPYIVGLMTELLKIEEGDKVLEIGTGSGYQAAVLNELTPEVYTIEIIRPLAAEVSERFKTLGYKSIKAKQGDGYYGWERHGPFDAIIVTCAAGHLPAPLWDQLKPGGRVVIPIGGVWTSQRLVMITKTPQGTRRSKTILGVRFVPMTGKIQER